MTTEPHLPDHRFGLVALIGRPNAGKSTLLNRLVGEKVAIVTHKPQTTRHRILGIRTLPAAQLVYVDTPGLHRQRPHALNRHMNRTAEQVLDEVDLIVVVMDARNPGSQDHAIVRQAVTGGRTVFVALNKVDAVADRSRLLPVTARLTGLQGMEDALAGVFYISALTGDGVKDLENTLVDHLPAGPPMFEADLYTDRSQRFLVAELIREQLLLNLHQELPYGTMVEIERYDESDAHVLIRAVVHVNEERHKGMVIGSGGATLKRIGSRARIGIEALLDRPVRLELWVRTSKDWVDDPRKLDRLDF